MENGLPLGYKLDKFLGMPFRITHPQASFQNMMNYNLKNLLEKDIVDDIDGILIYVKNTQ
jgi:hypothetical protein